MRLGGSCKVGGGEAVLSPPCCDVVSLHWEAVTTPSPLNPQLSNLPHFRRVFRYGPNFERMDGP